MGTISSELGQSDALAFAFYSPATLHPSLPSPPPPPLVKGTGGEGHGFSADQWSLCSAQAYLTEMLLVLIWLVWGEEKGF